MDNKGKLIKYFLLLQLFFLISSPITGQVLIRGTILSDQKSPLEYANVSLYLADSLCAGTITNLKGKFELSIDSGAYSIVVSYIGYDTYKETIKVNAKNFNLAPIHLNVDNNALGEIIVKGSSLKTGFNKTTLTINKELLKKVVVSEDLFKEIPFVRVSPKEKKLSVEGEEAIVLINGQRIVGDYPLLQLPSPEKIKRIEVIKSPSVKYAAEGITKVVNIVLKNESKGFEGSTQIEPPVLSDDFSSFNHLSLGAWLGKVHLFTNYNYIGVSEDVIENTTRETKNQTEIYRDQSAPENRYEYNRHSLLFGSNYFIDDKNLMNVTARYQTSDIKYDKNSLKTIHQTGTLIDAVKIKSNLDYPSFNAYNLSAYYKHMFNKKNHELSLDIGYFNFENAQRIRYMYDDSLSNIITSREDNTKDTRESLKSLLTYRIPVSDNAEIETGINYYWQKIDNRFYSNVDNVNDNLLYKENRISAYMSYMHETSKLSYQLGFNYETSRIDLNKNDKNNYTSLFPKVSVGYCFGEVHRLTFELNRKITRPTRSQLNPFIYILDQNTVSTGNFNLKPSYTDLLSLKYNFSKDIIMTRFYFVYGHTDDFISKVRYTNNHNQMVSSYDNVIDQKFGLFTFETELELLGGDLIIGPNVDMQYVTFQGESEQLVYDSKGWQFDYGFWMEYNFFESYTFGYDFTWNDYTITPQGKSKWGGNSYFELSKIILKNKGKLKLAYSWKMEDNLDIFEDSEAYQRTITDRPSMLAITFSYRFISNKSRRRIPKSKMDSEDGRKFR
ncbi:outer membrane beta-barrel protein [Marinifilum sp.]|uniref:outer membrane beta-barrel protein n=1 Tax=Marinifilum sp. TaxID=2033137 RepID=UPI003BACDF54